MWDAVNQLAPGFAGLVIVLYLVFRFITDILKAIRDKPSNLDTKDQSCSFDHVTKGALFDIKRDINYLKSDIEKIKEESHDLHQWHDVAEDGVKIWYVRKEITRALEGLASNVGIQTQIQEKIVERLNEMGGGQ